MKKQKKKGYDGSVYIFPFIFIFLGAFIPLISRINYVPVWALCFIIWIFVYFLVYYGFDKELDRMNNQHKREVANGK